MFIYADGIYGRWNSCHGFPESPRRERDDALTTLTGYNVHTKLNTKLLEMMKINFLHRILIEYKKINNFVRSKVKFR